jgi:hypothetical protein
MVTAFVKMLALIGGIKNEVSREILEEYREELFQFKYNYRYETYSKKVSIERLKKYLETDRMMNRLDAMTVKDRDIPKPKDD